MSRLVVKNGKEHTVRLVVAMSLPLLALPVADVSAPLPKTRITVNLVFNPDTLRVVNKRVVFNGPSVLMKVVGYKSLPPRLRVAALRLSTWVSEGISRVTAKAANSIIGSDVDKEWSMAWEEFSRVIALYTCPAVNTPTRRVVDDKQVPYIVSAFKQLLLDDDGSQIVSIEFALYKDLLVAWLP